MKQNIQEKKRLTKINKTLYPKKRANNPEKINLSILDKDSLKKEPDGKIEEQPRIREKTLELIAKVIGDLETGTSLISFLKGCGVDDDLIEYPQTKWRMIYSVFTKLSTSTNPEDYKTLFQIIEEAAHPLIRQGYRKSLETTDKFVLFTIYDFVSKYKNH